ncbi:hypothetical protein [Myxococcus vastator]|uniref:hypothetical protein n=1 Tax=Myxococcus vastator TaxID=2709664 RepID=UPI0019678219|nr:hypothetical protein [Myxococcus vastator]
MACIDAHLLLREALVTIVRAVLPRLHQQPGSGSAAAGVSHLEGGLDVTTAAMAKYWGRTRRASSPTVA